MPARSVPGARQPRSPVPQGDDGSRERAVRPAGAFPGRIPRELGRGASPPEGFPLPRSAQGVRLQAPQPVPALDGPGGRRGRPRDLDRPLPEGLDSPPGYPYGADRQVDGIDRAPDSVLQDGRGYHRGFSRGLPGRSREIRLCADPHRDHGGMHRQASGCVRRLLRRDGVLEAKYTARKLILPFFPPLG